MPEIKALWSNYEKQFVQEHSAIKNMLRDMADSNYDEAVDFAKKYSTGILCQMVEVANLQRNALLTKISVNQKDGQ